MSEEVRIRRDNPFILGYKMKFSDNDGILLRTRIERIESGGDIIHTVKEYDTLWDLSFDYYSNSKYWWLIYDANDLDDPFTLAVGNNIVIPNLDTVLSLL